MSVLIIDEAAFLKVEGGDSAVRMTGGQDWTRKGRYVNAGKTFLVETLAVLFAAGELRFAHDLQLLDEIEQHLASFTTATTVAGNSIITQSCNASER